MSFLYAYERQATHIMVKYDNIVKLSYSLNLEKYNKVRRFDEDAFNSRENIFLKKYVVRKYRPYKYKMNVPGKY